jgi:hyperosmotically inducible periplasmic protein
MTTNHPRTLITVAAALAVLSLGACNRADERTAGERVDSTVAKTEQAATEAKQEAKEATSSVKSAVSDASITASVNAELARDNELSALRIDVDTNGGKVALKGTAPNAEARERAAKLARSVSGVTEVDNQLAIKG